MSHLSAFFYYFNTSSYNSLLDKRKVIPDIMIACVELASSRMGKKEGVFYNLKFLNVLATVTLAMKGVLSGDSF